MEELYAVHITRYTVVYRYVMLDGICICAVSSDLRIPLKLHGCAIASSPPGTSKLNSGLKSIIALSPYKSTCKSSSNMILVPSLL